MVEMKGGKFSWREQAKHLTPALLMEGKCFGPAFVNFSVVRLEPASFKSVDVVFCVNFVDTRKLTILQHVFLWNISYEVIQQ